MQNSNAVEHTGEFEAVLGAVDALWKCAENLGTLSVQFHRNVVGKLATHAEDNALGILESVNIHYHLKRKTFKYDDYVTNTR